VNGPRLPRDPAHPRHVAVWRAGLARFAAGAWHDAHDCFEELWRAHGRRSAEGRLLQALVQLCASELKREAGGRAAARLAARAAAHLDGLPDPLLGVETRELAARIRAPVRPVAIPLVPEPVDGPGGLG
jgi:predicted metal-dependent hydrolase